MSVSGINPDFYEKPDKNWWTGRVDSVKDLAQFRYHQVVKCVPIVELKKGNEIALLGFASDVGVARNGGRVGASQGPVEFRKAIGSLCWHNTATGFTDVGNIFPKNDELNLAQKQLGESVQRLLELDKRTFVIGGGHETAFGHYLGVASFLKQNKPQAKLGILNIDAHFDLRPHNGITHSGSPFLQAHEHAAKEGMDLKYFIYGINRHNNTASLFDKADELHAQYVENTEIQQYEVSAIKKLNKFISDRDVIYLTICLDVFNYVAAPGVSAPAWNGIELHHVFKVLDLVKKTKKLLSMDVCELNPKYDEQRKTAKLAGSLFSEFALPDKYSS